MRLFDRPKLQFELYKFIKDEISKCPSICKLSYDVKLREIQEILFYLIKQLETKVTEIDIIRNYKFLGDIIINEDIGNPFTNNSFDALLINTNKNKLGRFSFGDIVYKVNWKNVQPTGYTKEVSLSSFLVDKYFKEKVSIVFIIKNSSDPNYYSTKNGSNNNMYYLDDKITTEGFQYYFLHYDKLKSGRIGKFYNYYYKVEPNGLLLNLGLRHKKGQLNLIDFGNEKNKTL